MNIRFSKMHSLGNDFVVIDTIQQPITLDVATIRQWGNQHIGIGFDQLLLIEKAHHADHDFGYRIFNSDGNEVAQCGNGVRCCARFIMEQGLSHKKILHLKSKAGVVVAQEEGNMIAANMGSPHFLPVEIPFVAKDEAITYPVEVNQQQYHLSVLSMGNPHAVLIVESVDTAPVNQFGTALQHHPRFPEKTNVGFLQILARDKVRLRVFERGVGETMACGTGACAAVVSGIRQGLLNTNITVHMQTGTLLVTWQGPGTPVWLKGPTTTTFTGNIML